MSISFCFKGNVSTFVIKRNGSRLNLKTGVPMEWWRPTWIIWMSLLSSWSTNAFLLLTQRLHFKIHQCYCDCAIFKVNIILSGRDSHWICVLSITYKSSSELIGRQLPPPGNPSQEHAWMRQAYARGPRGIHMTYASRWSGRKSTALSLRSYLAQL